MNDRLALFDELKFSDCDRCYSRDHDWNFFSATEITRIDLVFMNTA